MIIGLAGKKNSGKDTVAGYLMKRYNFERRAFADPLKKSVAALFDMPFSDVDRLKNDPEAFVGIVVHRGMPTQSSQIKEMHDMTFRAFLQRYGTEAHRQVFGDGFWVDETLPVSGFYKGRAIVVTDCRFDNEADRIRELGGTVVLIERPGLVEQDQHSSELIDFSYNYKLINDSTVEDLYAKVDQLLNEIQEVTDGE